MGYSLSPLRDTSGARVVQVDECRAVCYIFVQCVECAAVWYVPVQCGAMRRSVVLCSAV